MITSSYSEYQEYTAKVSSSITPYPGTPEITPTTVKVRLTAKDLLNPKSSQSLEKEYPDSYSYVAGHTSSGENSRKEQGWTEVPYKSIPEAGGMVRNALLSGSYGELKKLKVDSEVNAETISTSWSASIGENLHVGNAVGIAGYLQLGDSGNLAPGAAGPGQEITASSADNSEGIPDLRLVVLGGTHLSGSASVSGPLKAHKDIQCSRTVWAKHLISTDYSEIGGNLTVSGTTTTRNLQVDETASVDRLEVATTASTKYLRVENDALISGRTHTTDLLVEETLETIGETILRDTLSVEGPATFQDDVKAEQDLYVDGTAYISGNAVVTSSLIVLGSASFDGDTNFENDVHFLKSVTIDEDLIVNGTASYLNVQDLYVKDNSITVASGAISHEAANGAGFDIDGADVEFRYTSSTDTMGLNKGLDIYGDESVQGELNVDGEANFESDAHVRGDLEVGERIYGAESYVTNSYVKEDLNVDGTITANALTASSIFVHSASVFARDLNVWRGTYTGYLSSFYSSSLSGSIILSGSTRISGSLGIQSASIEKETVVSSSIQNLDVENLNVSGAISGTFYGDGSHLTNITASIGSSSTWKTYVDFEAENFQRVTHPFKTTDVFVQVYRWDDPNFHPDIDDKTSFSSPATLLTNATIKIIDTESIDIGYAEAVNGYVVISDAGMMITGSIDVFDVTTDRAEYDIDDPTSIYRFTHKLGTENVIVTVYQYADIHDGLGTVAPVQILPEQLSIPDKNHIDIVFGRAPISGYIVIAKAGHVIKAFDISSAIEDWNIHYGTEGNWTANSFTAVTAAAETVVAQDYVDAPRVGNKETGPQYYYSQSWESYLEFTSGSIDGYIKDINAGGIPDTRIVSRLDSDGNLKIRGSLITNETFETSDIRKKKDIEPLEDALYNLEQIKGVRFKWRDSDEPSIGVIAQDLQTIYPELTREVENLDGEEQLTVNYNGLIGVLIEAIKELSTRVKELERQNENR